MRAPVDSMHAHIRTMTIDSYRESVEFVKFGDTPELHMCVKTEVPNLVRIFWIPILVGEAALVGLAVYKGLQTQASIPNRSDWWSERAPYGFLLFLVRDSLLFFLMYVSSFLPSLRGYSADHLPRVFATFFATELVWVIAGVSFLIQVSSADNETTLIVLLTSPTISKFLSASPSLLRASGASASCSTSGDTGKRRRQNQSCTSQ